MIAIVDFNMGNLGSIQNMFRKLGVEAQITADPERIAAAEKLVLPGVGAFDAGMTNLVRTGLIPLLNRRVVEERVPTLGICLGMQLMTRGSSEGSRDGLGWIDAQTVRFDAAASNLKVPHMGWNSVRTERDADLTHELPGEPRFYFVHSYYVRCNDPSDVLLTTVYGDAFHSGFHRGNLYGVQFHPEKSHKFGMALLRNFATRVA